jgi:hypothetical protein
VPSKTREVKVSEEWAGDNFGLWDFAVAAGKALHSKNLAGALQTDGVECILSVGQEVKTEIPA